MCRSLFFVCSAAAAAASLLLFPASSSALVVPRSTNAGLSRVSSSSSSSLSALPPPLVIGPMIKKMREKEDAKKKPMADRKETEMEAPGLRVGKKSWKWPMVWPYNSDMFKTNGEATAESRKSSMDAMTNMLGGGGIPQQLPTGEDAQEDGDTAFVPEEFWSEQETSTFELDSEARQKLSDHFAFYLRDGMSILEFGAGRDSYLGDLKPSRHVGVSLSPADMEANPSLTDRLVVDLNQVDKGADVASDELRALGQGEQFDAVIMTNTLAYLTNPREVFKSAWYLLKPGGYMLVAFSSNEATKSIFQDAQTVMWQNYNDDQHIWITGSFFQFSAGDGWESLYGFDISPESAKEMGDDSLLSKLNPMKKGKDNNMFVVQARKAYQDETINPDNPEPYINSKTWMLPIMESRDKQLVVPRLARAYRTTDSEAVRHAIVHNVEYLPTIYEALVKMDQFAFTFSMQSQMAADLVCDPDFTASDEQMLAMRQGLGLRKPSEEFWLPVGQNTAAMEIGDKISLLAYIVPRFGSGNPAQEEALRAFVTGLKPTYAILRKKCPDLSESDVQLLGTELLASEVLTVGRSTREEYARWVTALSENELREILAKRKSYAATAKVELEAYKQKKKDDIKALEEYQKTMQEQIDTARKTRTLVFNPRTEKFETYNNPNLQTKEEGKGGIFGMFGGSK